VEIMIVVGECQWVVECLSCEWIVRDTHFLWIPSPNSRGDLLLRFGTTSLWLGGMSVPSSWLHNCFKNISVYLFSELIYEFNYCEFYFVNE
jgi:hypothetical protein